MNPVIEVNHLSKDFGNIAAVRDLSFHVNEADIYGFLGQNGAGKSTCIRMLLSLIRPTSGEIRIFGKELNAHRHEILRNTGAIIERPDMYRYLTGYENLAIFARMSGIAVTRKRILEQLDMVGLADRGNSTVKTYSQGMKQRLGIAIALVHDPKLIILDEPTNGLDPQGIADMRELILRLSHEMKKTVVISSHLLAEIEQLANRMIIIDRGKKIAEGTVASLLDPSDTLLQVETTDNNMALQQLQGSAWATGVAIVKQTIRMHIHKKDIPALVQYLNDKGIGIIAIRPSHSLEDYFLSLTNPVNHA